jgi:DNA processing protein
MVTTHLPSGHPDFPLGLLDLPRSGLIPCETLYIRGALPPPRGVAIVGTREATPSAVKFARDLAGCVILAGFSVWSGGARGIDAAAHQGALEASGATVMVGGGGLDVTYPPEHAELFAEIARSGGALLSPYPDGTQPRPPYFLRRNAVLAALTLATVVVQAPLKSGARSTAAAARKLGRPLFVVPHAPWDKCGAGCAQELELGARPLTSFSAFVAALRGGEPAAQLELPLAPERVAPERALARALQEIDEDATRVLSAIDENPIHPDDLCERTQLPFASVTAALLTLTLQAVVVEAPAGFYRRCHR